MVRGRFVVANSSNSRQVRSFGAFLAPFTSRWKTPYRCTTPVIRIIENMSDVSVTA